MSLKCEEIKKRPTGIFVKPTTYGSGVNSENKINSLKLSGTAKGSSRSN